MNLKTLMAMYPFSPWTYKLRPADPLIELHRSCIFEVTSQLSSGLLAVALMDHLKRKTQVRAAPPQETLAVCLQCVSYIS